MSARITVFSSTSILAKTWHRDASGKPVKSVSAQFSRGAFSVVPFGSASELAEVLGCTTVSEAVSLSLPLSGATGGRICTVSTARENPDAVPRSKQFFGLPAAPGAVLLDFDTPMTQAEALALVAELLPEAGGAGLVAQASGSSFIYDGTTEVTGARGWHVFILLKDASDGPRLLKIAHQRAWLAGRGEIKVSKSGSLRVTSPVDLAVGDAARVIFASGADCRDGLEQRRPPPVVREGAFFDSRELVPDLSGADQGKVEALIAQAKATKTGEAAAARAAWRAERLAEEMPVALASGLSVADAEARIVERLDARLSGVLLGDDSVCIVGDDGSRRRVKVSEVLADRLKFHGLRCLSIDENHRGGAPDAMLFLMGSSPVLFDLNEHQIFRLRNQRQRLVYANGARHELVRQLAAVVCGLPYVFTAGLGEAAILHKGSLRTLTPENLMNLLGGEVALFRASGRDKEQPFDLPRDIASLVLAALQTPDL